MNITITGRHEGVATAVRDYAHDKLSKILRIHDRISSAHMTLDQDHGQYVVEASVAAPKGRQFNAHSEDDDLRKAIDEVEHKLESQVRAWKHRLVDHHRS